MKTHKDSQTHVNKGCTKIIRAKFLLESYCHQLIIVLISDHTQLLSSCWNMSYFIVNMALYIIIIIIIIITTTIFIVLSSWQSHCESSLGSCDEYSNVGYSNGYVE